MDDQNASLLDRVNHFRVIFPENFHGVNLPSVVPYVALLGIIGFILTILPGLIWIERVVIALMQDRPGPNRVGPRGLLQSTADVVKLFFKEDFRPKSVDIKLYYLAPFLTMLVALSAGAVLPVQTLMFRADDGHLFTVPVTVGDVNMGLLYILAMSSLGVYGIVLAGWASNNKYSLLGGLRASAQLISYELSMGLSLLCVIVLAGSVKLSDIVEAQNILPFGIPGQPEILRGSMFSWFWLGTGLIPVVLYTISMIAETNRAPFDLPEAESELIAGFHTEYSSMKFATFFAGEYVNMLVVSALNATMFWGGWLPPLNIFPLNIIPGFIWFVTKIMMGIFLYCWLRATMPRLRYDALMSLGWKRMLPLGLVWLFLVAGYSLVRETKLPNLIPNSRDEKVAPMPPASLSK
jgi:NADH-quinone oxidoreductase subunit H